MNKWGYRRSAFDAHGPLDWRSDGDADVESNGDEWNQNGGGFRATVAYHRCHLGGNVLTQLISADAVGTAAAFSFDQEYGYDALNRVTAAGETGGSVWSQGFAYDLVGYRALVTGSFGASNMQAQASAGATATNGGRAHRAQRRRTGTLGSFLQLPLFYASRTASMSPATKTYSPFRKIS